MQIPLAMIALLFQVISNPNQTLCESIIETLFGCDIICHFCHHSSL